MSVLRSVSVGVGIRSGVRVPPSPPLLCTRLSDTYALCHRVNLVTL
jgi:hypothetical protein